ncbi:MAG: hypothetical protein SGBAC_013128 [Bacillariaceae sp.]
MLPAQLLLLLLLALLAVAANAQGKIARPSRMEATSPTLAPSESPSNLPSMPPRTVVTESPAIFPQPITETETETESPTQEPFLFLRPLQTMQLRLVGTYNATRQDELLEVLKRIAQDALYDSMVDSFVLEIDDDQEQEQGENTNTTTTTINATTATTNSSTTSKQDDLATRRLQLFNGNKNNSILYKVALEWISTQFQVGGDPFVHILQASGTLGFTMYDFVLLHPQTILPIQKQVMNITTTTTTTTESPSSNSNSSSSDNITTTTNNNNNNNTTTGSVLSLPQMELALRRNDFFFQVLEFRLLEDELDDDSKNNNNNDDEEIHDDGDEDDLNTLLNGALDDSSSPSPSKANDTTAILKDRAGDVTTDSNDDDEFDDDEPTVTNNTESVSNRTIAIALIVVCTVSTLAFGIFLKYVCIKSKQIKQDRFVRSEAVSANKKNSKLDNEDNENDKTVKTTSSPQTVSMAFGAPTPLSSLAHEGEEEEDDNDNENASKRKMARNGDGPTSVNLLQRMDVVEGTGEEATKKRLDVEEAKRSTKGGSSKNTGKSSKMDSAKRIAASLRLSSFTIGKDDGRRNATSEDKEKSEQESTKKNAGSEANDKSIAKRIGSSWSLPTFNYSFSPKGYAKADDEKMSAVSSFDYLDHHEEAAPPPPGNPNDLEQGSGDEIQTVAKDTSDAAKATSWRLPVLLKDTSISPEKGHHKNLAEDSTDKPNPTNSNGSEAHAIDAAATAAMPTTETGDPNSSEEPTADHKSTAGSDNVVEVAKEESDAGNTINNLTERKDSTSTKNESANETAANDNTTENLIEPQEARKDENNS